MIKIFFWPIVLTIFILGFLYTQGRLDALSMPKVSKQTGCDEECKRIISEEVAKAVATISGQAKTPITPPQSTSYRSPVYIPLDSSGSTNKNDWVDVKGAEVSFDLTQDYGEDAKVSWEALLKVDGGNGQATARLFDVTNNSAVGGSEISTSNNIEYFRASSGNIYMRGGRNVYRVQIKSSTIYEAAYTGGKIRISY